MTTPFAFRLHVAVAEGLDGENVVWSPFSVASALTLAGLGAEGATRAELEGLLGDLPAMAAALDRSADLGEEVGLAVANTLYVRDGLGVLPAYQEVLAGWAGSAVHAADFEHDPEGARRQINADVDKTTHGLIAELLHQGDVSPSTLAALVNAIWLKTAWLARFSAPQPAPFHGPDGTRDVPTMRLSEHLAYAEAGPWRMVSLAAHGDLLMDVLLGDSDLPTEEQYAALLRPSYQRVLVTMPVFRIESRPALDAVLARVGVRRMFTDDAELTGIVEQRLAVSAAVHQAVLTVDEQGLEGAAATALVMRAGAAMPARPIEFTVDRPFTVVVRHRETGVVYFLGRVVSP